MIKLSLNDQTTIKVIRNVLLMSLVVFMNVFASLDSILMKMSGLLNLCFEMVFSTLSSTILG